MSPHGVKSRARKVITETFVELDLVMDSTCFEQVSNTSLSLPPLQRLHDELKGIE